MYSVSRLPVFPGSDKGIPSTYQYPRQTPCQTPDHDSIAWHAHSNTRLQRERGHPPPISPRAAPGTGSGALLKSQACNGQHFNIALTTTRRLTTDHTTGKLIHGYKTTDN